jgi:hypothetical protein
MRIKLNRKGAASNETKELLKNMNDWMQNHATRDDMLKYNKKYYNEEMLQQAWREMQASQVEEATVQSESSQPIENSQNTSSNESFDNTPDEPIVSEAEVEEFDLSGFDPNAAETIQRDYNKVEINEYATEEIPEPTFSSSVNDAQTDEMAADDVASQSGGSDGGDQPPPSIASSNHTNDPNQPHTPPPPPQAANPAMNDLGDREKKIASEQLVDMVLELYGKAHEFAKPLAKVKVKKLNELEAKGLIDPKDTIPVNESGDKLTARELIRTTNEEIDNVLTPDPTFNGKVRPAMIREFTKRGFGVNDMQFLMIMFGQDIAMKASISIGLKKQFTEILNIYKDKQAEREEIREEESDNIPSYTADSIEKDTTVNNDILDDDANTFEEVHEADEVH